MTEVEATQNLLKMKFSQIDGLEDPTIMAHTGCVSARTLLVSLVSNSLLLKPKNKVVQHACTMLLHSIKPAKVLNEKVQKQQSSNDFTLFAISFEKTLCCGKKKNTCLRLFLLSNISIFSHKIILILKIIHPIIKKNLPLIASST